MQFYVLENLLGLSGYSSSLLAYYNLFNGPNIKHTYIHKIFRLTSVTQERRFLEVSIVSSARMRMRERSIEINEEDHSY